MYTFKRSIAHDAHLSSVQVRISTNVTWNK